MNESKVNKTILITGGSGFVGKNIVESFSKKYKVLNPSHRELELLDEDAVKRYIEKNKIDLVIHGAVRPGHRNAKDQSGQLYANTRMFFNIVRNSKMFDKLLYLGSGLVYDIRNYTPKMTEDFFDVHVPEDEAGFSKYISVKYIQKADNLIDLRIFGVFGKYEDYSIRFISNAICKTLFDLPITIKQNKKFDYIYIDDLLAVIEYFLDNKGDHKSYNVTPDHSIELSTLAEKVRAVSGKDLPILIAQQGMGNEYSGDNKRLRSEIKQLEFTPIDTAIKALYKWYFDRKDSLDRNILLYDK
jgi:GDP-L-fucose synthase